MMIKNQKLAVDEIAIPWNWGCWEDWELCGLLTLMAAVLGFLPGGH
jgi:hypothetical protein